MKCFAETSVKKLVLWLKWETNPFRVLFLFFFLPQINRLEGQVSRYKAAADNAEKIEDELKAEKRKIQREVTTPKSDLAQSTNLMWQNVDCVISLCSPTVAHSFR